MEIFVPVIVTFAILALVAAVVTSLSDRLVAAACGMITTGFGLMLMPICAADAELSRAIVYVGIFNIAAATITLLCFCAHLLEAMDIAVQHAPLESETAMVTALDPSTTPAALSLQPLIKKLVNIGAAFPVSQEHAHA